MPYYITWRKERGKNGLRSYAILKERLNVPGGVNSKHVAYLGKEPIAAVERLYREGKLTLEQVFDINDKKFLELRELKKKLKGEVQGGRDKTGPGDGAEG